MSKIREKESLECGRMHIWALKTQKLRGPLSRPWTPAANCSLCSHDSTLLHQQLSISEPGVPPWPNPGSASVMSNKDIHYSEPCLTICVMNLINRTLCVLPYVRNVWTRCLFSKTNWGLPWEYADHRLRTQFKSLPLFIMGNKPRMLKNISCSFWFGMFHPDTAKCIKIYVINYVRSIFKWLLSIHTFTCNIFH